ncbi:MAG: hypothetical protein HY669_00645 [Chloroflexi bacterium]|nr:hypothetical protein [Chloroflexota bacterium]
METQGELFRPAFTNGKYMSAKEKEQVLRAWETFLKNGCRPQDFTEALYHHLIQHCSFTAHYDRGGFYHTYFANGEDTTHFLTQFDRSRGCKSVEYGGGWWLTGDYADINNAMVDVAARYIPQLTRQAQSRQRQAEIARARALLAKHGIAVVQDESKGG